MSYSSVPSHLDTERKDWQCVLKEQAKIHYSRNWNGRYVHFGKSHLLTTTVMLVETFMLCFGYCLLMSSYPLSGVLLTLMSGFFLCRTLKNIHVNEMEEALGSILGKVETIYDLPIFSVKNSIEYPDINTNDLRDSIMRMVDENNKTIGVIFNFKKITYLSKENKPQTSMRTWVFYLNYKPSRKFVRKETDTERTIVHRGAMPSHHGDFLEHLIKNKGILESNGYKAFHLMPGGAIPLKVT